jgi:hypothetical protein
MDNVATIEAEQNMVADPNLRSIEDIIGFWCKPDNYG